MAASILAGLTVILILPMEMEPEGTGQVLDYPMINILMTEFSGFILEFTTSMIYTWIYFSFIFDKRINDKNVYGFALGAVVFLAQLCCGNLTGACINPMKHFGPALIAGNSKNLWVYWLGPLFGSFFAGFYYYYTILLAFEQSMGDSKFESMKNTDNVNEAMNLTY
jgi:glycerol uptake facilitator-like aquaporin